MPALPSLGRLTLIACALVAFGLASWSGSSAAAVATADAAWDATVSQFIEAHFAANPSSAVYAGRHEFDGRLPDLSATALQRRRGTPRGRACERAGRRCERPDGRPAASSASTCWPRSTRDLFWKKEAEWPYRNPAYYLGVIDPEIYLSKPYAPLETRMRAYIAYAREIPRVAAQIRANLRTPMPAPWIEYGVNAFGGFAEFFAKDVAAVYAEVRNPGLQVGTGDGQCRRRRGPCRASPTGSRPSGREPPGTSRSARNSSRACSRRPSR